MPTTTDALTEAAELARYAPSIHNSQPWRWRVAEGVLDLYLVDDRVLPVTDPDGRLAVLSCGTALHHARTALAAEGFIVEVTRILDDTHLARLAVTGREPVTPEAVRLVQTVRVRHTDRRPVTAEPADAGALASIAAAVAAEGTGLHVLRRDDVVELAAAASYAQRAESADEAWRAELAYWTAAGIPDEVIPATTPETTVPGRDFGHPGTLPISGDHDRGATFGVLYGAEDDRSAWLRAGEALSAAWLAATEAGLSLV